MPQLIFVLVALALLAGFVALTWVENRRGARVLAHHRARLDSHVSRVQFIAQHVDLAFFLREELSRLAHESGHLLAHLSLRFVRALERLLTRLVRHLRSQREITMPPRETMRDFVKTLSDLKGELNTTRPVREADAFTEISQIG